jgi:acetyltransferase
MPGRYPKELESSASLRDGTVLELRPIRPEDEGLLRDILRHMNPDDLRLRFLAPVRVLSDAIVTRLTQIDYGHEMAIMALTWGGGTALGVARFAAESGVEPNETAEFAIGTRSDWHRRGLGTLLITRLIAIARDRGLREIYGDVLRENDAMLRLCRRLGFVLTTHPDDATLVRVRWPLR